MLTHQRDNQNWAKKRVGGLQGVHICKTTVALFQEHIFHSLACIVSA